MLVLVVPPFATLTRSCHTVTRLLLPLLLLFYVFSFFLHGLNARGRRNRVSSCVKITGYGNSKPVPPPPWLDLKRVFTAIEYSSQRNGKHILITVFSKDSEKRIHWA